MRAKLSLVLMVVGLVGLTGCPVQAPPPEEAVLEGTWELTGDLVADEVSDFLITFDQNGQITKLSYKFGILSVVINDPDFIASSADVNGSNVTISCTWLGINNLVFDGVLNATEDQIDGSTAFSVVVGSIEVSAPTGDATLIKK